MKREHRDPERTRFFDTARMRMEWNRESRSRVGLPLPMRWKLPWSRWPRGHQVATSPGAREVER